MSVDQHAIFIAYRRDDSADTAGRMFDNLEREFGEERIFKDVDSIPPGMAFGEHIKSIIRTCKVFLLLIGPNWLSARNEDGGRRLDDPGDFVRVEIETALQCDGVQVVPVLVNGARMPAQSELPDPLRPIAGLQAAQVRRDPDFRTDLERLVRALKVGDTTGSVNVQAPAFPAANHKAAWATIDASLDARDYQDYLDVFPRASKEFEARRRTRQLGDWAAVPKEDPEAVLAFATSALFPALAREVQTVRRRTEQARDTAVQETVRAWQPDSLPTKVAPSEDIRAAAAVETATPASLPKTTKVATGALKARTRVMLFGAAVALVAFLVLVPVGRRSMVRDQEPTPTDVRVPVAAESPARRDAPVEPRLDAPVNAPKPSSATVPPLGGSNRPAATPTAPPAPELNRALSAPWKTRIQAGHRIPIPQELYAVAWTVDPTTQLGERTPDSEAILKRTARSIDAAALLGDWRCRGFAVEQWWLYDVYPCRIDLRNGVLRWRKLGGSDLSRGEIFRDSDQRFVVLANVNDRPYEETGGFIAVLEQVAANRLRITTELGDSIFVWDLIR